jgi:hypothetical protein
MPARVIRDAPGKVSEDEKKDQDERQRVYRTEG